MEPIKIHDLTPRMVPLSDILPYANNPRKNAAGVQAVRKSFREFGVLAPILVDKDMFIVYGHTRYQAALEEGLQSYPVVKVVDLTDEQTRAYRIADNALQDLSEWDGAKLRVELDSLKSVPFAQLPLNKYGLDEYLPIELLQHKEVSFTAKEGSKELSESDFQQFEHRCPRCGFEFNGQHK